MADENIHESASAEAKAESPAQAPGNPGQAKPRPMLRVLGIIGILAALAAWGIFFFDSLAAMILAVAAVVLSGFGIATGKGCLRDICVTALIAAAVLALVYGVFTWWLPYLVSNL